MKKFIKIGAVSLSILMIACAKPELERNKEELKELKAKSSEFRAVLKENDKKIMMLEALIAKSDGKVASSLNARLISVDTIATENFEHYIDFQGNLVSDNDLMLTAKGGGTLKKVFVKKGDKVRPGTLIALIDDEAYNKGIAELNTQLALAKTMYEKQKSLFDQNVGTEVQYLSAKTQYDALNDKLASLKHQQAEATRIVSSVTGTVETMFAHTGENAGPGSPICQIFGSGALKLRANVSETYSKNVKTGAKALIEFPDYKKTINSSVSLVSDVINPGSRSFSVEFDSRQAQGMKANSIMFVKIKDYSNAKALVVPTSCIMHEAGKAYVFVVDGSKKAKKVFVTKGLAYKNNTEIAAGIATGDRVITTGYQDITEGETVILN